MSEYFPEPKSFGVNVKVESDFKNALGADTKSDFTKKTDLDKFKI